MRRIPEPRGLLRIAVLVLKARIETILVDADELRAVGQDARRHVVVGDGLGLVVDRVATLGQAERIRKAHDALARDACIGEATRRRGPEVELPAEDGIRLVFANGVVDRLDESAQSIGERRVDALHQHAARVNRVGLRDDGVGRSGVVLREVAEEVRFEHPADGFIARGFLRDLQRVAQVGEVAFHVGLGLDVRLVGVVALAAVGDVVPDEVRDHAELDALLDEARGTLAVIEHAPVPPVADAVGGTTIQVDVAHVDALVLSGIGKVGPEAQVRRGILAHRADGEIAWQARSRAVGVVDPHAEDTGLARLGFADAHRGTTGFFAGDLERTAHDRRSGDIRVVRHNGIGARVFKRIVLYAWDLRNLEDLSLRVGVQHDVRRRGRRARAVAAIRARPAGVAGGRAGDGRAVQLGIG